MPEVRDRTKVYEHLGYEIGMRIVYTLRNDYPDHYGNVIVRVKKYNGFIKRVDPKRATILCELTTDNGKRQEKWCDKKLLTVIGHDQ